MKTFKTFLVEAKSKDVAFTFGRMNPPSIGHEKLLDSLVSTAKKKGAEALVFLSRTEDAKKNPLSFASKMKYLKKMYPGVTFVNDPSIKSPFHAMKYISDAGYKDVFMVVGGDRVQEFASRISPYVRHEDKEKSFEVQSFKVISAGERDPDAEGTAGASGTKMREFAKTGDFEAFKKNSPSKAKEADIKSVYTEVQKNLK